MSMTSLVDVIFLLLLFFMLSSTFTRLGEIEIRAASGGGAAAPAAPPVFLRLDADRMSVNGKAVVAGELPRALAALDGSPDARVIVALGQDVSAQGLVTVLAELRKLPDLSVQVLD